MNLVPSVISDPSVDSEAAIARDIAAVAKLSIVPRLLKLLCDNTGMGYAAVARVTDETWTACAVEDRIQFGLGPGGQLDLKTTLCYESRQIRQPIAFDHASEDATFRDHHTPRIYKLESYISVPIIRPDGSYFGNLCAIDPRPAQVSDVRTISMFTALADMIALQLSIDEAYEAAHQEVAEQRATAGLREQFIAVLGHDLRNPLAAIATTAELLARRPQPQDQKLAERLRSSTRRMSGLIDNLMDFARARLGSGIGVEIRSAVDLTAALSAVVDEARAAHPQMVIQDHVRVDAPVACDPPRIQQLLSNLLGNACHHGDVEQPVLVSALTDHGTLEISVRNRGGGIPPEDLQKIFQPYWRPATSKPGGGLGLGLYICSEIVKAHGGELVATSTVEGGTCFTARLPISRR